MLPQAERQRFRPWIISDAPEAPYSGMLPGHLLGHYNGRELHFDLYQLASELGIPFIHDEVVGIDPISQVIHFKNSPDLSYDRASINVGLRPSLKNIQLAPAGLAQTTPVKPIGAFVSKWHQLLQNSKFLNRPMTIAMAGGGPAAVEIMVALRQQLPNAKLFLFGQAAQLLPGHSHRAHSLTVKELELQGIEIHLASSVSSFDGKILETSKQEKFNVDWLLIAGHGESQPWLQDLGVKNLLPTDKNGFLKINEFLQVQGYRNLFAAGDCCHFTHPRYPHGLPKSGVFAVRMGPILAHNIFSSLQKDTLQTYVPQKNTLALIHLAPEKILASYGPLAGIPPWGLYWKRHIDQTFMQKFQHMMTSIDGSMNGLIDGSMDASMDTTRVPSNDNSSSNLFAAEKNHCTGCGSKLAAGDLCEALKTSAENFQDNFALKLQSSDAVIASSIDTLKSLHPDPYIFSQVALLSSLNDLWANGLTPEGVSTSLIIAQGPEKRMQHDLARFHLGVSQLASKLKINLLKGHTSMGHEMWATFHVIGSAKSKSNSANKIKKGQVQQGDCLILTKPIGSGLLLTAWNMPEFKTGLTSTHYSNFFSNQGLLKNHSDASTWFQNFSIHACTDVSGFGLMGHLFEILSNSMPMAATHLSGITLSYDSIPSFQGVDILSKTKLLNSIYNLSRNHAYAQSLAKKLHWPLPLPTWQENPALYSPETNGAFVLALPQSESDSFIKFIRNQGFREASVIGHIK